MYFLMLNLNLKSIFVGREPETLYNLGKPKISGLSGITGAS